MAKLTLTKKEESELNVIRNNIKELILKQYPTIEKFCYENGLAKSSITDLIRGKNSPSLISLMRIRDALEVSMHDIIPK